MSQPFDYSHEPNKNKKVTSALKQWAWTMLGSLRVHLMLLVILSMLPVFGLILASTAHQMETQKAQVKTDTVRMARLLAANQEQAFEGARQLLITLAQLPQVTQASAEDCSQFLRWLQPHYPNYALLAVANLNGDITCSSVQLENPINIADRAYFQYANQTSDFSVGGYHIGRITSRGSIGMAYPVQDQVGKNKAIVFVTLDLASLKQIADRAALQMQSGMRLVFIDRQGSVLLHYPDNDNSWEGRSIAFQDIFKEIQSHPDTEGNYEAECLESQETCLFAFRRLNPLPNSGYVLVSMPTNLAFEPINNTARYQLVGLLLVSAAALAAAWISGNHILITRIRLIGKAIAQVSAGNLNARTHLSPGPGELRQLALSFDQMANSLQERENQLKNSEAARFSSEMRLADILQNASEAIVSVDEQQRIIVFNKGAEKIFGYQGGEILGEPLSILFPEPYQEIASSNFLENDTRFELIWKRKNGESFPGEGSVSSMPADGSKIATIFLADITDRRQAMQDLQESRRELATLLSNLPGMAYRARKAEGGWAIELASEGAHELTGFEPNQLTGSQTNAYHHLINTEDFEQVIQVMDQSIQSCQPYRLIYRIQHATGKERWVWEQGRPVGANPLIDPVIEGLIIDITDRRLAEEKVEHQMKRLGALRMVDTAINGMLDLKLVLSTLVDQIITQLKVDAAAVLLFHQNTFEYGSGRGFRSRAIQRIQIRLGEGFIGNAALNRQLVFCPDVTQINGCKHLDIPALQGEDFLAYGAVPLIAKSELKGVLVVFHHAPLQVDQEWLDFLEALGGQAAIAIENATLFEQSQRSNLELNLAFEETIEGWANALELRHQETLGHSRRVVDLTLALAQAIGIPDSDLVHIRRGAILHDIGKMGIPDSILLKQGPLTEEEWVIMRQHAGYAYKLLSAIPFLRPALDIPYRHHERWDGSGYPNGLKGNEIPLAARIFAVVDVWDALRNDRPYRKAISEEQTRQYLLDQAGREFDPQVVEAFLQILTKG